VAGLGRPLIIVFFTFLHLFSPFYTFLDLNLQTQQTPKPKTNPKQAYHCSIFSTVVLPQHKNETNSFHPFLCSSQGNT